MIPWATFTSPEVARVGLNEDDARAQGIPVEVTRYGIDDLDRAIADGSDRGFVKVLTPPFDSAAMKALPKSARKIPIPVMVTGGEVCPADSKLIWPYICKRR